MNSKKARNHCKREILRKGMHVVERVGHLFIVEPVKNFVCHRYYGYAIASVTAERLDMLREEFSRRLAEELRGR